MRLSIVAMVFAGVALLASAQTPAALTFEVVSIRRSPPDAPPGRAGLQAGGRYTLTNGPVRILINAAYPSLTNEIIGAPDWVTYENYDVTALATPNVTPEQLSIMMRTMLSERFDLVARVEERPRPVYLLVLAQPGGRLGPRMRRTETDCIARLAAIQAGKLPPISPADAGVAPCTGRGGNGLFVSTGFTMEGFAARLTRPAGRLVLDKTGLEGPYDFTLEYAPEPSAAEPTLNEKPSLFTALQEQLGLKLEPAEAPVSVVIIERINRPTPD